MPPHHPQRLSNFSYVGPFRYSLRFSTDGRRPLFSSTERVDLVKAQFLRALAEERFAGTAYCFMPDHVHLLVEGQAVGSDLKRFIKIAKQYSGFYYARQFQERLWQRYGFERVLRDSEPTLVVARYILENPVRAGLVERIDDYPFVGSFAHSLRELVEYVYSEAQAH
jgi:putative transposase